MDTIHLSEYRKIVALTGAGVSVASGLPTYRGPDGIWDDDVVKYAMAETWNEDPLGVWRQFARLRSGLLDAVPNAAHHALVDLQQRLSPSQELHLITQNVDGLHQAAGSEPVIELHGNLRRTRCSESNCESEAFSDLTVEFTVLPICEQCGGILRPDIVLFGEPLSWRVERDATHALRGCDLFLAIGTSGTVTPAANFVRSANYEGARTVLVNLEPMDPRNPYFDAEVLGRAEDVLPGLFA